MQEEEKGPVKSNVGEWCKRQRSGSYDGIIGRIQITKTLTLTFLLQIFFACDVRCVFMTLLRSVCFEQISGRYLGISGGTNRSDAVDMVKQRDDAGTATILTAFFFF